MTMTSDKFESAGSIRSKNNGVADSRPQGSPDGSSQGDAKTNQPGTNPNRNPSKGNDKLPTKEPSKENSAGEQAGEGDPVNMATGKFLYADNDFVLPGMGGDFLLTRRYAPDTDSRHRKSLGKRWTFSCDSAVTRQEDTTTVTLPDACYAGMNMMPLEGRYLPKNGRQTGTGLPGSSMMLSQGSII